MAKDYNISKTQGVCCVCERELAPGDEVVATVIETEDPEDSAAKIFQRRDYCPACWDGHDEQGELFGLWRTRVPRSQQKKKLFVDDDLLINFFERLEGAYDEAKIAFRFVLALALMRKKLLVYDCSTKDGDGREVWRMHFKGAEQTHEVVDPHMNEERIAEVSQSLGQILEGEL